jgi:hypothetical protein
MVAGSGTGAAVALPLSFPQYMVKLEVIYVLESLNPKAVRSISPVNQYVELP